MSLLKFFWSERSLARKPDNSDPLAEPEIAAMSQRELADLPLTFPAPKPTRFETPRLSRCA